MKNLYYKTTNGLVVLMLACLLLASCTKKFKEYNQNTNGVTDEQLIPDFNTIGGFYPAVINNIIPSSGENLVAADISEYAVAGSFAGYMMNVDPGASTMNYRFVEGWEPYSLFKVGYNSIMAQVNEIKRRGAATLVPDYWAVALILKVAFMHKVTDTYGPIPYSQYGFGGTSVPYDNQHDIYYQFFKELDTAATTLFNYVTTKPGVKPFTKFDQVYAGDYMKWLKFANSLRLRLALQIVKVDPQKAKLEAEKAVNTNGGVFLGNEDNFVISNGTNCLIISQNYWNDTKAGASIITYMKGYKDPRISKYFMPSTIIPGEYVGIRSGSKITARPDYSKFSSYTNGSYGQLNTNSPIEFMNSAVVYFMRAEGALRGWDMGGTAQELYEKGIKTSFNEYGLDAVVNDYVNDASSKPADHVDPVVATNSSPALSAITIKWNDAATNEEKLERIITQEWISNFPNCTESWSVFRRTGYPKIFPVAENNSSGTINTDIQIRRMIYPGFEYVTNSAEVSKGVTLLGGPDTGGTRVWWDLPGGNF